MSQRKKKTVYYHLHMQSKKIQQTCEYNKEADSTDTENRLVFTSGEREVGRLQT